MLTPAMSSHMSQGARASCLQVSMELVGGTSLSTHDARAMDGSQSLWVPRSQAGHTALPPLTPLFPRHHLSPGRCGAVPQTPTPGGAIPALGPGPAVPSPRLTPAQEPFPPDSGFHAPAVGLELPWCTPGPTLPSAARAHSGLAQGRAQ